MQPCRPHQHVAIGIVVEDGRVLITRRPPHVALGSLWEFPGGKQHAGESPEDAAVRELKEELAIDVTPVRRLAVIEHAYAHAFVVLTPVLCRRAAGEPIPRCASEWRWVPLTTLPNYAFPPANHELIRTLTRAPRDTRNVAPPADSG